MGKLTKKNEVFCDEYLIDLNATQAAIASVKVKVIPGEDGDGVEREVRLADKLKALELCGKHLGMFKDSPDSTAPVTVVINYDYGPDS